jgi:hypothetical protein
MLGGFCLEEAFVVCEAKNVSVAKKGLIGYSLLAFCRFKSATSPDGFAISLT